MKFKVGDKVEYEGKIGIIKAEGWDDCVCVVEFIEENERFHDCSGMCKMKHGYYCVDSTLKKYNNKKVKL